MTLPADIRVNVRAPFPAQVHGAAFIALSKSNGIWTISPDYLLLAEAAGISATQILALYDTASGQWTWAPATAVGGGGGGGGGNPTYRIVTAPGTVAAAFNDDTILLQKATSGASTIAMPTSASRAGLPLTVKDLTYDANTNHITFVPSGSETLDGFSAAAAAANGLALIDIDGGAKTWYPLTSGGWYAR